MSSISKHEQRLRKWLYMLFIRATSLYRNLISIFAAVQPREHCMCSLYYFICISIGASYSYHIYSQSWLQPAHNQLLFLPLLRATGITIISHWLLEFTVGQKHTAHDLTSLIQWTKPKCIINLKSLLNFESDIMELKKRPDSDFPFSLQHSA